MIPFIRKRPLLSFYLLTFFLTWIAWLPQAATSRAQLSFYSFLFYSLAGVIPMFAAYVVLRVEYGKDAAALLVAPLLKWKVPYIWYAVALLAPLLFIMLSVILGDGFAALRQIFDFPFIILFTFFNVLVTVIPEELAWRGFVLPRLQKKYSALVSSLVIGLLWALWFLPLFLNLYNVTTPFPVLLFFVEAMAVSIILTWLFNSTKGSVLVVTLFQALWNTVSVYFFVESWARTAVIVGAALLIILVFGPLNLSRLNRSTIDLPAGEIGVQE